MQTLVEITGLVPVPHAIDDAQRPRDVEPFGTLADVLEEIQHLLARSDELCQTSRRIAQEGSTLSARLTALHRASERLCRDSATRVERFLHMKASDIP